MPDQGSDLAPEPVTLDGLLDLAVQEEASDLLLQEGEPPRLRIGGRMVPSELNALSAGQVLELIRPAIPDAAARSFEESGSADFSLERARERWRVALYQQRGGTGANLRLIPLDVPTIEDRGLPDILKSVADLADGLVLVTGAAGSGKSSTVAALVRDLLERRPVHVVTIEDPIEYILPAGQGVVTQREVGQDVPGFSEGLRAALRQQVDALVVGEIRDRETADTVLNAAETGSLVLSSLHTRSASETLSRLLEMFPDGEKQRVRGQLSRVLKGIFSQMLIERADGTGLVAAMEILRASPPIQARLEEGDISGIAEEIESSVSYYKMQSMNQSLAGLVLLGAVSKDEALRRSPSADDLDLLLRNSALAPMEGDPMAEQFSDYSRIHEFLELKNAHEQELIRHKEAEASLRQTINELQAQLQAQKESLVDGASKRESVEEDLHALQEELQESRRKLELAVGRLQQQASRLRERATGGTGSWWRSFFGKD